MCLRDERTGFIIGQAPFSGGSSHSWKLDGITFFCDCVSAPPPGPSQAPSYFSPGVGASNTCLLLRYSLD